MKHGVILIILIIITSMTTPILIPFSVHGSSNNKESTFGNITIYGYVADVATEKNQPLPGVNVSILDVHLDIISSCTTSDDGRFELTYKMRDGMYLRFDRDGYTIRSIPGNTMKIIGDSKTLVEISLPPKVDSDGKYMLTTDPNKGSPVLMRLTSDIIHGYVYGFNGDNLRTLKGATITLESVTGQRYITTTDVDGYFQIDCQYGTYVMAVRCKGFEDDFLTAIDTETPSPEIILREKTSNIAWGLDMPHTLELSGISLVALITLIYMVIYHVLGKKHVFIDDIDIPNKNKDDIRNL